VSGVLRELTVCLCKWNHQLDRAVASFFARVSGCHFQRDLICPSAEVGDELASVVCQCLFCFLPVLALSALGLFVQLISLHRYYYKICVYMSMYLSIYLSVYLCVLR
jgi:hypothetical protein